MSDKEGVATTETDSVSTCEDPIIALKSTGNAEYAQGNYATAIESFTAAIAIMKARLIELDEAALTLIASDNAGGEGAKELSEEQKTARTQAVETRTEAKVLAATLFCNRSMCYSGLEDWSACVEDSRMVSVL